MQTQQASQQQIQQTSEEESQRNALRLTLAILGFIITVIAIVLYCDNVITDMKAATLANSAGTIVSYIGWLYPWQVFIRNKRKSVGGSGSSAKRKADFSIIFLNTNDDYGYYTGFKQKIEQEERTVRPSIWDGNKDLSDLIKEEQHAARHVYSIVTYNFLDKAKKNSGYHKFKKMNRTRRSHRFFFKWFFKERHALLCVHEQPLNELRKISAELNLKLINLAGMPEAMASEAFLSHIVGTIKGSNTEPWFAGMQIETNRKVPTPQRYFTGRKKILADIHAAFQADARVVILRGLKGIGKTQIALAYAQQQQEKYRYIFLLRMSSYKTCEEDLKEIGNCLKLAEIQDPIPRQIFMDEPMLREAFKNWLNNSQSSWLLILDDCNDLKDVNLFDTAYERGHILLTTSNKQFDISNTIPVEPIEVSSMNEEEGALFLLRLTGILDRKAALEQASDQQRCDALEISGLLGNLPDALEIAGKYINRVYGAGDRRLRKYIELYKKENHRLKEMYADILADDGEKVVVYAWYLSFEQIQTQAPEAAEILLLCSLLGRSAIPTAIIQQALQLDPIYQAAVRDTIWLNNMQGNLLSFSLLECEDELLIINPHMQDFLRGTIKTTRYAKLAEYVVAATSLAFPEATINEIQRCKQYVPHVKACEELIAKFALKTIGVARLYDRYGSYLREMADYEDARMYLEKGLALYQKLSPADSTQVATSMSNLAHLHYIQGNLNDASDLYQRALQIQLKAKTNFLAIALASSNLADIYTEQNHPANVGKLRNAAQQIWEIQASEQSVEPFVKVTVLKRLAYIYYLAGEHSKSDEMYKNALAICGQEEDERKTSFPETGICRANLARSYFDQKVKDKYEIAELYYDWALKLCINILGANHPQVATMRRNLADLYIELLENLKSTAALNTREAQKYYNKALAHYEIACKIYEQLLPHSPAKTYVQRMKETLRKDYPDLWNVREREQKRWTREQGNGSRKKKAGRK